MNEKRWIPVSEMLPKENETVIASTKYGIYPEAHYTKEYGWEWAYESGADYWVNIIEDVTAWMPLPQPYEEMKNENISASCCISIHERPCCDILKDLSERVENIEKR